MPKMRITKRYNNASEKNGLLEEDFVDFTTRADGYAWVYAVQRSLALDWDLVDYEWAVLLPGVGKPVGPNSARS